MIAFFKDFIQLVMLIATAGILVASAMHITDTVNAHIHHIHPELLEGGDS